MPHPSIIYKIQEKYGRGTIYASDCVLIADDINHKQHTGPFISVATVMRLLGCASAAETTSTPRATTLDIIARWLDYDSYKSLLASIGTSSNTTK